MNASEIRDLQRDATRGLGGGAESMAEILSSGASGPPMGKKTGYPESTGVGHEHSKWEFLGNRAPQQLSRSSSSGPVTSQNHLDHHQYSRQRQEESRPDQGTHTTRFHRGFARRNNEDIHAEAPRLSYESHIKEKSARHEVARRERLAELNSYNKFNLINGAFDPTGIRKGMQGTALPDTHTYDAGFKSGAKATGMHPQMHTVGGPDDPGEGSYPELTGSQPIIAYSDYNGSRLNPCVARDGRNLLSQSHYRFFRPAPSGERQDARQMMLVHEGGGPSDARAAGGGNGQVRKKVSNLIGTQRYCDELPSFGAEDQFSKAGYGKDAHEFQNGEKPTRDMVPSAGDAYAMPAYFGLVETTKPGLYTPRKQATRLRMMMMQQQLQEVSSRTVSPGSHRHQDPTSAPRSARTTASAVSTRRDMAGGGDTVNFSTQNLSSGRAMTMSARSGGGGNALASARAAMSARESDIAAVRALC